MAISSLRFGRILTLRFHRSLSPVLDSSILSSTTIIHQNPRRDYLKTQNSWFRSSLPRSSARSSYNNDDDKISPDTILFEGCDYNHWLITMDFPKDPKPTPEEMVETYVQTLAKVVGSVEEAKKKMYACSTTTYNGFQAVMTEEMSEKFRGLPGVVFILPDSYIDPVNKEYGGDKYDNGTIIPRPPPVQYGRQGRYGDRNRNRQGPPQGDGRNYGGAQQNYRPPQNFGPSPSAPGGVQQNYGPSQNFGPGGAQQNYGPPQNFGPSPSAPGGAQQNYGPPQNFGPSPSAPGGAQQNYGPPQNFGPSPSAPGGAQQNYGPPQNFGPSPSAPGGAQPNYGPPQNFGPSPSAPGGAQQNYGSPQNFGPSPPAPGVGRSFGGAQQSYDPPQNFGPSVPRDGMNYRAQQNYPPQRNLGSFPTGHGDGRSVGAQQNHVMQQNYGSSPTGQIPVGNRDYVPEGRDNYQRERSDPLSSHQRYVPQANSGDYPPLENREFREDSRNISPPAGDFSQRAASNYGQSYPVHGEGQGFQGVEGQKATEFYSVGQLKNDQGRY